MKLFSVKSFHQTSMQEIADVCGMSKGSLYIHFKSKEELLLNIFQYYFQLIEDQIIQVDQEPHGNERDRFCRKLEVQLNHFIEYQEFYKMQMQEIKGLADESINKYIQQKNEMWFHRMQQSLLKIYGNDLNPFVIDCTLLFNGMIAEYMKLMIINKFPLQIQDVIHFLLRQLDFIVKGITQDQMPTLISLDKWNKVFQNRSFQLEMSHPLSLVYQMKEKMDHWDVSNEQREIALESIRVLEQELLEIAPRKVILQGMLLNLQGIKELDFIREKLNQLLHVRSI